MLSDFSHGHDTGLLRGGPPGGQGGVDMLLDAGGERDRVHIIKHEILMQMDGGRAQVCLNSVPPGLQVRPCLGTEQVEVELFLQRRHIGVRIPQQLAHHIEAGPRLHEGLAPLRAEAFDVHFFVEREVHGDVGGLALRNEQTGEEVGVVLIQIDVRRLLSVLTEVLYVLDAAPAAFVLVVVQCTSGNGGVHHREVFRQRDALWRQFAQGVCHGGHELFRKCSGQFAGEPVVFLTHLWPVHQLDVFKLLACLVAGIAIAVG